MIIKAGSGLRQSTAYLKELVYKYVDSVVAARELYHIGMVFVDLNCTQRVIRASVSRGRLPCDKDDAWPRSDEFTPGLLITNKG